MMTPHVPPTVAAIERLERRSGYAVGAYLRAFAALVTDDLPGLTAFYRGQRTPDPGAVARLAGLRRQAAELGALVQLVGPSLARLADIQLQAALQECRCRLDAIHHLAFYLRSNRTLLQWQQGVVRRYTTSRGETPDQVARRRLGARPGDEQTWQQLIVDNNLDEEQLEPGDSLDLVLRTPAELPSVGVIQSTLGPQDGAGAGGRDLSCRLTLDGEAGDLFVLAPEQTQTQAAEILLGLRPGALPQFPDLGLTPGLVVGHSAWQLALPTVIRQLQRVISTDDSFRGLQVTSARREGDALLLDLDLQCLTGTIPTTTTL